MNNIKISENFKLSEFECRCCKTVKLDSELLERLQKMRDEAGRPLVISGSGYRCPAHNRAVGGASGSQHMEGKAADYRIPGMSNEQQRQLAEKHFPDGGVGFYNNFVHVDVRGRKARWSG